ncbi:MAG: hypothetical protein AAFN30_19740, partial [Actinomycetota bacterium]
MSNPWGDQEPGDDGPPSEPPYTPPGQAGAAGAAPGGGFTPPQPGQPEGAYPPQQPPGNVPPYTPQQPPGNVPPYTPAGAGAYVPASGGRTSQASTAIGLSVSGLVVTLVLGFCCGPFGVVGLVLCGIGAYLGTQELRAIDAGTADPVHRGQDEEDAQDHQEGEEPDAHEADDLGR